MTNKKVPAIRFNGFTNEWVESKLGDVADIIGGGTPNTSIPEYWDDDIDWYTPSDLCGQIYISQSNRKLSNMGLNQSSAKLLPIGSVLFTSRASIGLTSILMKSGATNQGFQSIIPKQNKLDSYFIFTKSYELKIYGERMSCGNTFKEVSKKSMINMKLHIPSLEEQNHIGALFSKLDTLITNHEQQLDHLQMLKKAYLQRMFPRDGKSKPEVRFNGFTSEWVEAKLGDVATFSKGSGYSKKDVTDNGTPIILYGQLYTNYQTIIDTVNTFVNPKNKSVISEGGEVIVPASSESLKNISRASVVKNKGVILGGDLNIIKPYSDINPIFLALTISHGHQQTEMLKRARGTTIIHLYNSDLKQINLIYPSLEEQERIGNFFKHLDDKIKIQETKIEQLKLLKKGLLQHMII